MDEMGGSLFVKLLEQTINVHLNRLVRLESLIEFVRLGDRREPVCRLARLAGAPLVEDEVLVVGEEVDDGDAAVGGRANHRRAVCSLVVGLYDLVVLAVPVESGGVSAGSGGISFSVPPVGVSLRYI